MNQVTATYNACGGCKTAPLWQYDYGQELVFEGFDVPSTFEVHFANEFEGEATTQIASDDVVTIPDQYLTSGANIYAWIFLHTGEDDGETVFHIEIPVMERAQPTDETPTPVQQSAITEAISALQDAVSDCEDAVSNASGYADNASDYAEDAHGYASDAQGYASDAQSYAEAASSTYTQILAVGLVASDDGNGHVTLSIGG